jgi:hypothetical protein
MRDLSNETGTRTGPGPRKANSLQGLILQHCLQTHLPPLARSSQQTGATAPNLGQSGADADADTVMQRAVMAQALAQVTTPDLQVFLASVFTEPEVSQVLMQPSGGAAGRSGSRVQALQTLALDILKWSPFGAQERAVIHVATFLIGIEHALAPCVMGNSSVRDVMFTIVRTHLHQLEQRSARSAYCAAVLRKLMGWANEDDEAAFTSWLRDRMVQAVRALDSHAPLHSKESSK